VADKTALYPWHVEHGARMVEFAGWTMPIQYTTIVEEHHAVRTAAGIFDISHMGRLSIGGPDAFALLQKVFTNDVASMRSGQVRYGLICNEQGGVRDDVLVYRWQQGFAMVVNAGNRHKIYDWLLAHRAGMEVEILDRTLETCMVAVQGPRSAELCRHLTDAEVEELKYYFATTCNFRGAPCVVSRTGYTGEDGFEFIVNATRGIELWTELIARGALPCGLGARDTLRLEAAMPLYGHELTEEIDPFQAGLSWAVKLDKGDFIGREALLRRRDDPALPRRVGLQLSGRRIAREGYTVWQDGKQVGQVTSGTFAPTLQKSIAMAYVRPDCAVPGTPLVVDVRGHREPAQVVPLPFYKRPRQTPG